jgi:hypothetical protein
VNLSTMARLSRAAQHRADVMDALRRGETLTVSNRTQVSAGLVHAGLAAYLVRRGQATHPHVPGATEHGAVMTGDTTRIVGRGAPA